MALELGANGETRDDDLRQTLRFLGRAVATLAITPPHLRIYRELKEEAIASHEAVPTHSSVLDVSDQIASQLRAAGLGRGEEMSPLERARTAGLLMQFGDHFREIPQSLLVPYGTVYELYESFVSQSDTRGRLSLPDQMAIALDQSGGAVDAGFRNLFITSRMYARWLDEKVIKDLPPTVPEVRKNYMETWQGSLLGFKPGGDTYHDTAGDTYYAWTHAYAGYVFESLSRHKLVRDALAQTAFRHGTYFMQTFVNNLNPRGVISDHTIAARYGNAIADVVNRHMGGKAG